MKRLYLQIYLAFVGILLLFGLLISLAWVLAPASDEERELFEGAAAVASQLLPAPGSDETELREALELLGERLHLQLALHDPPGTLVASTGDTLPPPLPGRHESHFLHSRGAGLTVALRLGDGRWLVARHPRRPHRGSALGVVFLFAIAIAAGAYPMARRLTRRLERLQQQVEALGQGELSVRVEVEGQDEVANLARSFNRTAERIERLVVAQKSLLAGTSHELRSPLARIRMALELAVNCGPEDRARRKELMRQIEHDIDELDALIEELLLASRLDVLDAVEHPQPVDLLGLVTEEASRLDIAVTGDPAEVQGDRRLLRRMVRNLLENALIHGGARGVEAAIHRSTSGGIRLEVSDRGPGVAEADRERIFEPFFRSRGFRSSTATSQSASEIEGVRTNRGVGMGLALVRQIARHHGGDARYRARPGGGSSFEIDLN